MVLRLSILLLPFSFMYGMENTLVNQENEDEQRYSEGCDIALNAIGINKRDYTLKKLEDYFAERNIKNYNDAIEYGRKNAFSSLPSSFNHGMVKLFASSLYGENDDIIPENSELCQLLVIPTSNIDSFMERLAFIKRIFQKNGTINKIVALVGSHPHRKDLKNMKYLAQLPSLFASEFALTDDQQAINEKVQELLKEEREWTHKDGMQAAWTLVSSDPIMKELHSKFCYLQENGKTTQELFEKLISSELDKPISQDNPLGIIAKVFDHEKLTQTIEKICGNNNIKFFIAKQMPLEVQTELYNDSPDQEAYTRLYHFYEMLKKQNSK